MIKGGIHTPSFFLCKIYNNDIIRAMLTKKFAHKLGTPQAEKERDNYSIALENKAVSSMIYNKLGLGKGKEQAQRVAELSKLNIKAVLNNIEQTNANMKDIEKDFLSRGEKLDVIKADLKANYEKKLQGAGLSQQASIETEYFSKLKEVNDTPSMKLLQEEYTTLETKLSDLNDIKAKYIQDNQELIQKQLLQRKREEIENSELLDS
jgi:hypothetical protein